MIYTSCYSKMGSIRYQLDDVIFVSISGVTPREDILRCKELMPKYVWWNMWHEKYKSDLSSREAVGFYRSCYYETVLDLLDPVEIYNKLQSLGKTVVLLCYEEKGFCHRHLVREWFQLNGLICREF